MYAVLLTLLTPMVDFTIERCPDLWVACGKSAVPWLEDYNARTESLNDFEVKKSLRKIYNNEIDRLLLKLRSPVFGEREAAHRELVDCGGYAFQKLCDMIIFHLTNNTLPEDPEVLYRANLIIREITVGE